MIERIIKTASGHDVILENGERKEFDIVTLNEVIGYDDDEIVGKDIEGNVVRINVHDSSTRYCTPFRYENKRLEIKLCGENCWHVSQDEDEDAVYELVFEFLRGCPMFDYIDDLVTYLIGRCIECRPADELSEELMHILYLRDYEHACEEGYHYNARFEIVFELAKIAIGEF